MYYISKVSGIIFSQFELEIQCHYLTGHLKFNFISFANRFMHTKPNTSVSNDNLLSASAIELHRFDELNF